MFNTYNFGVVRTSIIEFFMAGLIFLLFSIIAFYYQTLKRGKNPEYKYYTAGIVIKMLGSFFYYFIYAHYYPGGDTTHYFEMTLIYRHVFIGDPIDFLQIFLTTPKAEHYNIFWNHQIWPFQETYYVPTLMTVIKIATPFCIISGGSFLITTLFMGIISFYAVWSLYKAFLRICPNYTINFIACFLIPSSVFWASGISKDTITLVGICLIISGAINYNYTPKDKRLWMFAKMIFGFILILNVKPYVIIALFPSAVIWRLSANVKKTFIQWWLRSLVLLFTTAVALGISFLVLGFLGESMEKFAVDKALGTAVTYNQDLKADYHKGQSFDIGQFDATIPSIASKIPIAGFAGIFYPLPGQVSGLVPSVSTIEGTAYFLMVFYILLQIYGFRKTYTIPIEKREVLNFFLMFSVIFCIMLGLSTSNFGALVRFRVPALPFLSGYLLIHIYYLNKYGYIRGIS